MELPADESPVLPDTDSKRKRTPSMYAVVYADDQELLQITECETRRDVKKFLNTLANPTKTVRKIYRVSATIELKSKTVVTL